jgi:hypothetical protein
VGRKDVPQGSDRQGFDFKTILDQEKSKALASSLEKTIIEKKQRKIERIKKDIEKLESWREIQGFIQSCELSQLNELVDIKFGKITLKLPKGTVYHKADYIYKKIKDYKAAIKIQNDRLAKIEKDHDLNEKVNNLKVIQPVWRSERFFDRMKVADEYEIYAFDGYSIGIGKSARGNDQLRKSWAKQSDIWVHASDKKSAHAIVKFALEGPLTQESIKKAAHLIAKYSGYKGNNQIEIVYTQVKNVKGVSGHPGMVIFKKEKRINIDLEEEK